MYRYCVRKVLQYGPVAKVGYKLPYHVMSCANLKVYDGDAGPGTNISDVPGS